MSTLKRLFGGGRDKRPPTTTNRPDGAALPAGQAQSQSPVRESRAVEQEVVNEKITKELLLKQPMKPMSEAADPIALFIHKLKLCSITFDWVGPDSGTDVRCKDVKRQLLIELVDYIGTNKEIFVPDVLEAIVSMVSVNLFRPLPPKHQDGTSGPKSEADEDDPVFEPSWPHLQIVYEFFLRFIVSSDVDIKTLKKYINPTFVLQLLSLFDSEDHRERDYLKTILHRIYAKFMALRAFIRKAINNVFWTFIYETQKHNGIAELFEILGSIINGFALPLKPEHKNFLCNVLTPMHKVKGLSQFHQQLQYCVTQFVDKDPTLAVPVLSGLIKYWPVTNSSKEVLFLNELEELLELTQQDEFKILLKPLFTHLSRAIGSAHFQVAERALFLWHNEYISGLIADHRGDILPIIYPVLHENSERHWNLTVKNLTYNVLKIFIELDQEHRTRYVEICSKEYLEKKKLKEARYAEKSEFWQKLQAEFAKLHGGDVKAKPREKKELPPVVVPVEVYTYAPDSPDDPTASVIPASLATAVGVAASSTPSSTSASTEESAASLKPEAQPSAQRPEEVLSV